MRILPVKLECYEDIYSRPEKERIFGYGQETIAPEVGETCVFPFEDGYGVHHGCRKTIGLERKTFNGSELNKEVKKFSNALIFKDLLVFLLDGS